MDSCYKIFTEIIKKNILKTEIGQNVCRRIFMVILIKDVFVCRLVGLKLTAVLICNINIGRICKLQVHTNIQRDVFISFWIFPFYLTTFRIKKFFNQGLQYLTGKNITKKWVILQISTSFYFRIQFLFGYWHSFIK